MDSGVRSNYEAQFGKYTLIAKLATGGMGEIFLAKLSGMAGFEKLVVLKRLLPHLAEDQHFVTMLLDEARIAARLSHPNVCQVYDLGEVDGVFYIAMEFLEGVPCSVMLKAARQEESFLEISMAANILEQACAGLHHAHCLKDHAGNEVGLVHRDVSPSNIFATISGSIKILDFGVAKSQDARARTHTGALKGKYAYMSPEQVMAHDLDRRSDIFSLGIVFFELLTTRRLFWRDSEYKMFQAIAEDPIPDVREFRSDVPSELAEIIARALSRDAANRFDSAEIMGKAIGGTLASQGGVAPNSVVASYVGNAFSKQIHERRELVVTAVSPHNQPTVADGRADMGEHSREASMPDAPEIFIEESPDNLEDLLGDLAAEQKSSEKDESRGLGYWLVLAAFGILVALAGSFLFGLMNKGDKKTASVADETNESPDANSLPVVTPPEILDIEDDKPRPPRSCEVSIPAGRDPLSKAFLTQQGKAVQACLVSECEATNKRMQMILSILINRDGRVSETGIAPPHISRARVGKCLRRAASRTRFPASEKRLRIKIPLAINTD